MKILYQIGRRKSVCVKFAFYISLLTVFILIPASSANPLVTEQNIMRQEKRIALLIGNGDYKNSPLINPVNDVKLMDNVLQSLGFQVIKVENATLKQMKKSIDEFGEQIKGGGTALFYYAGHGMQIKGINYLLPTDAYANAEEDVEYESVDVGRVLAKMASAGNRINIVMLDACRNNPFARKFRSAQKGLATVDAPKGTFIAYATAPGSVAGDGNELNGIFTKAFVNAVQIEGLKIEEVFKKVSIEVIEKTNESQIPWQASSLVGDFFFKFPQIIYPKPPSNSTSSTDVISPESEAWAIVKASSNISEIEDFLNFYPTGQFAPVARLRLRQLRFSNKQYDGSIGNKNDADSKIKIREELINKFRDIFLNKCLYSAIIGCYQRIVFVDSSGFVVSNQRPFNFGDQEFFAFKDGKGASIGKGHSTGDEYLVYGKNKLRAVRVEGSNLSIKFRELWETIANTFDM